MTQESGVFILVPYLLHEFFDVDDLDAEELLMGVVSTLLTSSCGLDIRVL